MISAISGRKGVPRLGLLTTKGDIEITSSSLVSKINYGDWPVRKKHKASSMDSRAWVPTPNADVIYSINEGPDVGIDGLEPVVHDYATPKGKFTGIIDKEW